MLVEEGKLGDDVKAVRPVRNQIEPLGDVLPDAVERRVGDMRRRGDEDDQVTVPHLPRLGGAGRQVLGRRSFELAVCHLQAQQPPAPADFASASISSSCFRDSVAPPGMRIARTRSPLSSADRIIANSDARNTSDASKISSP